MKKLFVTVMILLAASMLQAKDDSCIIYDQNETLITLVQNDKDVVLDNNEDYRLSITYKQFSGDSLAYDIIGAITNTGVITNRTAIYNAKTFISMKTILEGGKIKYFYGATTLLDTANTYIGLFTVSPKGVYVNSGMIMVKGVKISDDGSRKFMTNVEVK